MTLNKTAALLAAITAIGAGSAHAATLNADMDITANVSASCQFSGPGDQNFVLGESGMTATSRQSFVLVNCNLYLPYILETDAGPQGEVTLTDASTGKTIPVFLIRDIGGDNFLEPWGSQANGEEWAGTGAGTWQYKKFLMDVNAPPSYYGGDTSRFKLPEVGTYVQTVNFTLTY